MEKDLILCVAPNGAYKTKEQHPKLPIRSEEIAETAYEALRGGANMIHLHVREDDGSHSLDSERYLDALAATKERVGDDLVIQITTEAAKKFEPPAQMEAALKVKPEAVSLGLREFVKKDGDTGAFREFWQELNRQNTWPQVILYDEDDLDHLLGLRDAGVVEYDADLAVLFVLGRYKDGHSSPDDLIPFLKKPERLDQIEWSVCAFGPYEHQCLSAALALGGHVRVGFENNLHLLSGEVAPDNAALVRQIAHAADAIGRDVIPARNLRRDRINPK